MKIIVEFHELIGEIFVDADEEDGDERISRSGDRRYPENGH